LTILSCACSAEAAAPPLDTSQHLPLLLCDIPSDAKVLDLTADASLSPALTTAGCRVAAVGGDWPGRESLPPELGVIVVADCRRLPFQDGSFDLIALDATSAGIMASGNSRALLKEAGRALRPNGQLLIAATNRLRRHRRPERRASETAPGPSGYGRLLKRMGLRDLRVFGAQPKEGSLTLVAALDTRMGVQRLYARSGVRRFESRFLRMLGGSPLGPRVIARTLIVASRRDGQSSPLERQLGEHLRAEVTAHWIAWSNPGQAVARVSANSRGFIVRLALDADGAIRLHRNAEALEALGASDASEVRAVIPRLVTRTVLLNREATIETLLSGEPADTVFRRKVQHAAFLDALNGIGAQAAASNVEWMKSWLSSIRPVLTTATSPAAMDRLCAYCQTSPELSRMRIGRVHGDWSPRNVLLDRRNGEITGVIDWDLSAEAAPTFVDPLHWEIRSRARDIEEYHRILVSRVVSLRAHLPDAASVETSTSRWWRESLWAHIVYGVWYNLNIARWLPEPRIMMAARLLDHVP
jgi:SAM-dependent methyltransferase